VKKSSLIAVLVLLIGGLLIYSGVKNRNPIDVIKLALQGKDIGGAAPLSNPSNSSTGTGSLSPANPFNPNPPQPSGPQIVPGPSNAFGPI
jgi:hypothetical protein